MSGEVEHLVNEMHRDEYDFHYAVCDCGYRSTPVPDIDILIDEMMAHAQRLTPDDLRAAVVPRLDYEAAAYLLHDLRCEVAPNEPGMNDREVAQAIVDAALAGRLAIPVGETSQGGEKVRAKRLRVSMHLLQQALHLPDGATVIDVRRGDYETVELLVIDESFPLLPDGAEVPEVQLEVSRVESRWVEGTQGGT